MRKDIKRIACIAMKFPAPSETFHSNNVRVLSELCKNIDVYNLLSRHPMHDKLIQERDLSGIKIDHTTVTNYAQGFLISIFRHPILLFKLIFFILKWCRGLHLLKSFVLIPRIFFIVEKILKNKPDVIYLLWGHYPALVGFVIKQIHPEIILSMNLLAYDLTMDFGGSCGIVPYTDFISTQAEYNITKIQELGFPSSKILLIYDGLNLKKSIGKSGKIPYKIITIGRLMESKGIDLCILAFALISKKYPNSTLTILGDGPEMENLKDLASRFGVAEKTSFKGHVNMDEVAEELASAEIFIFMSFKIGERLPNVVKEAMANKAICVCSHTPGIEELMTDKQTGFILTENTAENAANLVDEIFQGKHDTQKMATVGYSHIIENFNCEVEMRKLSKAWCKLERAKI